MRPASVFSAIGCSIRATPKMASSVSMSTARSTTTVASSVVLDSCLAPRQRPRPHELAEPERQHVVGHEPDHGGAEQAARSTAVACALDEEPPAHRAQPEAEDREHAHDREADPRACESAIRMPTSVSGIFCTAARRPRGADVPGRMSTSDSSTQTSEMQDSRGQLERARHRPLPSAGAALVLELRAQQRQLARQRVLLAPSRDSVTLTGRAASPARTRARTRTRSRLSMTCRARA